MSHILSQEEVDALLRGLSEGDIETEPLKIQENETPRYDLTSQERINRGKMPALDMTNERFARAFRSTMSSFLRKVVIVNVLSVEMIKFGDYLKTLPVPTSLHLFRLEPLRGSAIVVIESKMIFTIIDIMFGGTGKNTFKIEGREFTAIENNLISKIVQLALQDLEKAWSSLFDVKMIYQRSEVNPQFAHITPVNDSVMVINFEMEMEYSTGVISVCIPYSNLNPIKDKLYGGLQNEIMEADKEWAKRLKGELVASSVELLVMLGKARLTMRHVKDLQVGDVILLDRHAMDSVDIYVEDILKFKGHPGIFRGNQAVKICNTVAMEEVQQYGAE